MRVNLTITHFTVIGLTFHGLLLRKSKINATLSYVRLMETVNIQNY